MAQETVRYTPPVMSVMIEQVLDALIKEGKIDYQHRVMIRNDGDANIFYRYKTPSSTPETVFQSARKTVSNLGKAAATLVKTGDLDAAYADWHAHCPETTVSYRNYKNDSPFCDVEKTLYHQVMVTHTSKKTGKTCQIPYAVFLPIFEENPEYGTLSLQQTLSILREKILRVDQRQEGFRPPQYLIIPHLAPKSAQHAEHWVLIQLKFIYTPLNRAENSEVCLYDPATVAHAANQGLLDSCTNILSEYVCNPKINQDVLGQQQNQRQNDSAWVIHNLQQLLISQEPHRSDRLNLDAQHALFFHYTNRPTLAKEFERGTLTFWAKYGGKILLLSAIVLGTSIIAIITVLAPQFTASALMGAALKLGMSTSFLASLSTGQLALVASMLFAPAAGIVIGLGVLLNSLRGYFGLLLPSHNAPKKQEVTPPSPEIKPSLMPTRTAHPQTQSPSVIDQWLNRPKSHK